MVRMLKPWLNLLTNSTGLQKDKTKVISSESKLDHSLLTDELLICIPIVPLSVLG